MGKSSKVFCLNNLQDPFHCLVGALQNEKTLLGETLSSTVRIEILAKDQCPAFPSPLLQTTLYLQYVERGRNGITMQPKTITSEIR